MGLSPFYRKTMIYLWPGDLVLPSVSKISSSMKTEVKFRYLGQAMTVTADTQVEFGSTTQTTTLSGR